MRGIISQNYMRQYIKKIQSKSEDTRKLIFLGSMIASMSFVTFIWVYNLDTKFSDPKIKQQANEDIKPFKLFSSSISGTYKDISASVGKASVTNDIQKEINAISVSPSEVIPVIPSDETSEDTIDLTSPISSDLTPIENNNQ